jgi:hypothetical protein
VGIGRFINLISSGEGGGEVLKQLLSSTLAILIFKNSDTYSFLFPWDWRNVPVVREKQVKRKKKVGEIVNWKRASPSSQNLNYEAKSFSSQEKDLG